MTERYGLGMPANAMADAISRTNQYNADVELSLLRAEVATLRRQNEELRKLNKILNVSGAQHEAELAALRPLKPIAERVLAALAAQCYDGSYDERPIMELRKALDDLAAQEDGEK